MQVAALHDRADKSTGRTDVTPQRYQVGSSQRFTAVKS
jgi:hypothetical protein